MKVDGWCFEPSGSVCIFSCAELRGVGADIAKWNKKTAPGGVCK